MNLPNQSPHELIVSEYVRGELTTKAMMHAVFLNVIKLTPPPKLAMTVTYLEFSNQNLVFSDEEKCMAVLYWTPLFLVCFRKLTVL